MDFIEAKVIHSFKYKLHYFKYVDDCFSKNEKDSDDFFTILKQAHNAIKFTVKKEINNELLDILVNVTTIDF